jgi:hypothetical protein
MKATRIDGRLGQWPSRIACLLIALASLAPAFAEGITLEAGVTGGGGLSFSSGGLIDKVQAELVDLGTWSVGAGTATRELTPCWTAGAYLSLGLGEVFKLGLSPHFGYLGDTFLAKNDQGKAWERWSVALPSVLVPITARAGLRLSEAFSLEPYLGPELGILAGSPSVLRRHLSDSVTVAGDTGGQYLWLAALGGLEAHLVTDVGVFTLGFSAEAALFPITLSVPGRTTGDPALSGEIYPYAFNLYLGWGWPFRIGAGGNAGGDSK